MNEYIDEFNKIIEIKEFRPLFSKEEDERRIRNSEKLEGYEQGQQEEKIVVAKNLLKQKIDIDIISEVTGLSIDFINNLNNK